MLLQSVNYYIVIHMPPVLLAESSQVFSGINLRQRTPIQQRKKLKEKINKPGGNEDLTLGL